LSYAGRNNLLNNFNMGNPYNHESTSMPPLGKKNQYIKKKINKLNLSQKNFKLKKKKVV
jgi:hypothetical protein